MARVAETKFARETLFRIQKPFSYAGKVFRASSIEQRDNGKVMVTGFCAASRGNGPYMAEYGAELEVHENTPVQALVDAGINLDALNVYLAARKERQAYQDEISARVDRQRAAEKLVRDAAPELLEALKALAGIAAPHLITKRQYLRPSADGTATELVEETTTADELDAAIEAIAKATGAAS